MLHTFKEFLSRVQIHNASLYANNVSQQLFFPFFLPLQKTAMPLSTVALSVARRHLRDSGCGRPWLLPLVQSLRGIGG
jgi:hypothetical protein